MADFTPIRVSELPEVTNVGENDYLVVDDGIQTSKIKSKNYNERSSGSAKEYADEAARSASLSTERAEAAAQSVIQVDALAQNANESANHALDYSRDAEAWAKGTRDGSAVPITDATHENNAKYFAQQAHNSATSAAESADAAEELLVSAIDPTLTQAGKAADAKATGDRLLAISEYIEPTYKYVPIDIEKASWQATQNGVTFTQNTDGTVVANGTNTSATNRATYVVRYGNNVKVPVSLEGGKTYRFRGCPAGGSEPTYNMDLRLNTGGPIYVDDGNGIVFTVPDDETYYITICIGKSYTVNNLVFSPVVEEVIHDDDTPDGYTAIDKIARSLAGVSDEIKDALLDCFAHVAWIDTHGPDYYEALRLVFYPVSSISAVYTQSGAVDVTDSLDSLKTNLVVTATKTDSTQFIVPSSDYELNGTLTLGTSTITVTYQQKTTTFEVIVTDRRVVYQINDGTDLTGKAINTGLTVFQPNDSYTILIEIDLSALASDKTQAFAINHKGLSNGTLRLGFDQDANHIEHFVTNVMYADSYAEEYTPGDVSALTSHNLKWAVRMSNKNVRKVLFVDGRKLLDKTENISSYMSDKSFEGTYYVGSMSSTVPGSFTMPGIANLFRIYNTALTDSEIASILNVTL